MESIAPVRMQRLGNSVPWALVALILIYASNQAPNTTQKVLGFTAAALVTVVSWRSARMRLLLGEEVVVIGWFHSTRIPWREVEKFDVNNKGLYVKQIGGLEKQVPAFSVGGSMIKAMKASQMAELQGIASRAEKTRKERQQKLRGSVKPKAPPKPPPGKRKPRA